MARGGYRKPSKPQGPSGPGKNSRRVDANQPKQTPSLDNPDLEYGEVQALANAQDVAPLPRGAGTMAAQGGAPASGGGGGGRPGELPPFMFDMSTANPNEPGSAGMMSGPGMGPEALSSPPQPTDDREAVLQYLALGFGNPDAQQMLADYRATRMRPTPYAPPVAPSGLGGPGLDPSLAAPEMPTLGPPEAPPVTVTQPPEGEAPAITPTGEPPPVAPEPTAVEAPTDATSAPAPTQEAPPA